MLKEEKNYYPSLTGIRAIAAWLVFIHHFNPFAIRLVGNTVHTFFSELHIGVTVFFVLSGLLITLRYYDRSITSPVSFYNYMVNRFARIYPVFFLILTANFIWFIYTDIYTISGGWKHFLASATFLRGFFELTPHTLVPQSWSLTVEECFYFSCPLIFLLIRKHIRSLIIIPLVLIGTGLLITWHFMHHPFYGFFKDVRFLFNFTFLGRCIEFFTGIALALLYKKFKPQKKTSGKFTLTGILIMIVCIAALAYLHDGELYGDHHPIGIMINNLLLPVAGIAVLFWGLLTERNLITNILSSSPIVLLGKSSYIFYLIHVGLLTDIFYGSISKNPILLFVFLNVISILLYKVFEHPVNIWLRKKLLRKEQSAFPDAENKSIS